MRKSRIPIDDGVDGALRTRFYYPAETQPHNACDRPGRPLVIFFDTDHGGHIPLHTSEFIRAVAHHSFAFDVLLCLPEAILGRLPSELTVHIQDKGRLQFRALTADEIAYCNSPNSLTRGRRKWKLGQDLAKRYGADHVFYYVLDIIFAGALINPGRSSRPFSGILFRPRLHVPSSSLLERVKRIRQWPYYALSLLIPALTNVWTLDPFFGPFAKKWLPYGSKVQFIGETKILPDGIGTVREAQANLRVRFLMFGLLKERKGILVLLEALKSLTADDWLRIEIALVGEFEAGIRDTALALIEEIQNTCAGANLDLTTTYVAPEVLAEEVQKADVILVNYLNHVGSSGVMFAAALAGRPVITQRTGLLGSLAETYCLGATIDTSDSETLAATIRHLSYRENVTAAFDGNKAAEYVALNQPDFAHDILLAIDRRLRAQPKKS